MHIKDEGLDPGISTHTPRAGSDVGKQVHLHFEFISTHTPRAGSDTVIGRHAADIKKISTHTPRAGSDITFSSITTLSDRFQPTLPVRGVTRHWGGGTDFIDISTHTPRAGSDASPTRSFAPWTISTHTPRAGSDEVGLADYPIFEISTHTPRAGSDAACLLRTWHSPKFQPTLPVRGVTQELHCSYGGEVFQPTLPVRGVTQTGGGICPLQEISTHTPRAGSDQASAHHSWHCSYFNPHSPCHTPRAGSDSRLVKRWNRARNFNPHSPCGE